MRTIDELRLLQALPLSLKIKKTEQRIKEWVDYFGLENVYVSFSGGKDSSVLLDICRKLYPNIQSIFCNTGLEHPEIVEFVKTKNCDIIRPSMTFRDVIIKYGYPLISKEVSECVDQARKCLENGGDKYNYRLKSIKGEAKDKNGKDNIFNRDKYEPLLYVDFKISNKCCHEMKKKPFSKIKKYAITGQTAEESMLRTQMWLKNGCNAFEAKKKISNPMSFWKEQDILKYIKDYNLSISNVYGDIVTQGTDGYLYENTLIECGKLKCSGMQRTGCIFCLFGGHLDTQNNGEFRLNLLKRTHFKLYDYVMRDGEYVNGIWQPSLNGLGYWHIIKVCNELLSNGKLFYDIKSKEIEKYENDYKANIGV